ncbi:oxysterol-binding protein-related protein 6-like isoform X2 [Liolophura sinensis]|uniref:oxysterol-binding protein-related protein 6-like isoform X2 n=1 Tax=Liolophura sinensis TaxID=3198878 RepID=UPI00315938C9
MSSDNDNRKSRDNLQPNPVVRVDKSPLQKSERMSREKLMQFRHSESLSDSDGSEESISGEGSGYADASATYTAPATSASSSGKTSNRQKTRRKRRRRDWEFIEGLRDGQKCADKPDKHEGYLMKKRKWPLKGWHKRYFVLDKGIITYAKSPSDVQKGKYHGVIDIGLSVLAFKQQRQRLYIDAEDSIYHIKLKDTGKFNEWLAKLKHHRLYRQHEISYGTKETPRLTDLTSPSEEIIPLSPNVNFAEKARSGSLKRETLYRQASIKGTPIMSQNKVATWLLDTAGIEHCNKDLSDAKRNLYELRDLLDQIQNLPIITDAMFECPTILASPRRKKMGLSLRSKRKTRTSSSSSNSTCTSSPQHTHLKNSSNSHYTLAPAATDRLHMSSSNPNLVEMDGERPRPTSMPECSLPDHETRIQDIKIRENFLAKAEEVTEILKSLVRMIGTERDRLKQAFEQESGPGLQNTSNSITALKTGLAEALKQNADLRSRLTKIHADSAIVEPIISPPSPLATPVDQDPPLHPLKPSLSAESCSVADLYFDAEETLGTSDSSSEASDEEEISSDISDDNDTDLTQAHTSVSEELIPQKYRTGRRSVLPRPKPDVGDISLWSLLCKNIGKDLSKISMPVTLNEPLNVLQRLCEELEYSELLDKAAEHDDPYERMLYVAAFAVSAYASTYHRAGYKPFNPLLEETYENIREDKGWRFVAEQVSHHPPISACHCESRNFIFKQDMRIKNKFWGKSMEIQPLGTVTVSLPKYNDHYTWNKVTTCVHNIFGGQRWVDQYGEMTIRNRDILCKISFAKASYWSSKRHELVGQVLNPEGRVVHHLFGKWNEALYSGQPPSTRCIWRPGAMPDDYELYYGFSRFAIELNDPEREHARYLPPTDTRFRPDQRLLEEGRIEEAEKEKLRLEQLQRDRRRKREENNQQLEPRWFRKVAVNGQETYEFNGKYWELRKEPGFIKMTFTKLW